MNLAQIENIAPAWAVAYNPVAGGIYIGEIGNAQGYVLHKNILDGSRKSGPLSELTKSELEYWMTHRDTVKISIGVEANE